MQPEQQASYFFRWLTFQPAQVPLELQIFCSFAEHHGSSAGCCKLWEQTFCLLCSISGRVLHKNIHALDSMCGGASGQAGFTPRGLALSQSPQQLPCMAATICKQRNVLEGQNCSYAGYRCNRPIISPWLGALQCGAHKDPQMTFPHCSPHEYQKRGHTNNKWGNITAQLLYLHYL